MLKFSKRLTQIPYRETPETPVSAEELYGFRLVPIDSERPFPPTPLTPALPSQHRKKK